MYVLGLTKSGAAGDSRQTHTQFPQVASRFPIAPATKPSRLKQLQIVERQLSTSNLHGCCKLWRATQSSRRKRRRGRASPEASFGSEALEN